MGNHNCAFLFLACNLFCATIRLFALIPEVDSSDDRYTDNKIPDKRVKCFNEQIAIFDISLDSFVQISNPFEYCDKQ